jgi:hypothetical protein
LQRLYGYVSDFRCLRQRNAGSPSGILPALYAAWFRILRPKAEATILLPQAQEPVGSSPAIALPV